MEDRPDSVLFQINDEPAALFKRAGYNVEDMAVAVVS